MKKKIRTKRFFTLIEILISLTLMAILSTTLFFWVRFALINHKSYEQNKWVAFEEYYCKERLEKFFISATLKHNNKNGSQPVLTFFSRNNSVIFTCDVGSFPLPKLSKIVLSELFLTPDHTLAIALWPLPNKGQNIEQEPNAVLPLLDRVEKIDFFFYHPDDPFKPPIKPDEVGKRKPNAGWNVEWPKEADELPTLIKLVIERQQKGNKKAEHIEWLFETDCNKALVIVGQGRVNKS